MKTKSALGCLALLLSVGLSGACTARIGGPGVLDDGAAVGDGIVEGDQDGDLGGDFLQDEQGDVDDGDNPFAGGQPPFDYPNGLPPFDYPDDDVPPDDVPPDDQPPECNPVPEICNNGVDDDCDGYADGEDEDCEEPCVWSTTDCSDVELIGHCNAHPGDDLNACYAAGNSGNCGADEFYAWCTRRVFPEPGPWYDYIHDWVANRCNGTVHFEVINGEDWYWCEDAGSCERWECKTPLVLLFEPEQAVTYHADDGLSSFDLSTAGDGSAERTDWPTALTPWLALDRDGDGSITSGQELFGSASPMPAAPARNGFEALRQLDDNGDGVLDDRDARFADLVLWADRDANRMSQSGELSSVAEARIVAIDLSYAVQPSCDARGNCEVERARFLWHDADGALREGVVVDVHLAVRR